MSARTKREMPSWLWVCLMVGSILATVTLPYLVVVMATWLGLRTSDWMLLLMLIWVALAALDEGWGKQ